MKNLTIARRYAKALQLIGEQDGRAEHYKDELERFENLISKEKSLEQTIGNPFYESASRKRILGALIEKLELSAVMKSFLLLLFDKGRMGYLSTINELYQKLADDLRGVSRDSLVSAFALSPEAIEKISESLSKLTKREIILEVEQDPELIGGVVTRIGDLVLDGSIKTQLLNMRESLKRGERG